MKHRQLYLGLCMTLSCASLLSLTTALAADTLDGVVLSAEQRNNLGIEVQTATVANVARTYPATAQVIDASPLIAVLGDLRVAQAAEQNSHNELQRAQQLHAAEANVSLKTVEATRAQSIADEAHVATLRAQILSSWGSAVVNMSDTTRERLIAELLADKLVLIRAQTRADVGDLHFKQAQLHLLTQQQEDSGHRSFRQAQVLGATVQAGTQTTLGFGRAYLLTAAAQGLQIGEIVAIDLNDAQQTISGIKLPRAAIVRWQGGDWVFVESATNRFTRHSIQPLQWLTDGCLAQGDIHVNDRLVIVGSGMLLAAESIHSNEKSGAAE